MTIPDPMLSFIAVLKADAGVAALVGTRIFGEELPESEINNMPRACSVLSVNGGRFNAGTMQVVQYRFNAHSYGETLQKAIETDFAIYEALKGLSRWGSANMAGILTVDVESGPFLMRDPDTRWPKSMTIYRAWVGEA